MHFSVWRGGRTHDGTWLLSLVSVLICAVSVCAQTSEDDNDRAARVQIGSFVDLFPAAVPQGTGPHGSPEKAMEVYNKWLEDNSEVVGKSYESMSPGERERLHQLMTSLYSAAGDGEHALKTVAYLVEYGLPQPSQNFIDKGYPVYQIDATVNQNMAKARDAMIHDLVNSIGAEKKWRICLSDTGNTDSGMKSDLDQTVYVFRASDDGKQWVRDESLDLEFIRLFQQRWKAQHGQLSLQCLDIASIPGSSRFPDPRVVSHAKFVESFKGTIDSLRRTPGAYTTHGAVVQQMQLRALNQIERQNLRAFQVFGPEEGKLDGTWRRHPEFNRDLAMETVFCRGMPPELMTQHAFGAAVANYFELLKYMHKDKFETKYHLRTWDDCHYTMQLLSEGKGRNEKREYLSLSAADRTQRNETILAELFPGEADKQRHHALALEISCELRRKHKGVSGAAEAVQAAEYRLAQDMFGEKFAPQATDRASVERTRIQLEATRQYYRRLASEFSLASIRYSSVDAFKIMLGGEHAEPLLNRTRAIVEAGENLDWDTFRTNVGEACRLTLMYAIYDLGRMESVSLIRHINQHVPGRLPELLKLWAKGRMIDVSREVANYRAEAVMLGERVRTHVLSEFGFENAEEIRLADLISDHQNITWNWRKLGNNMFNDIGTVDSLAQVLLTFYESKGDMDQVFAKAADEVFMAVPLVGQVEQLRRADMLQRAQILLVMKYATLGKVMVVYSIGSATYRIFEIEVLEPHYGNEVDAVYRGFVGPELRDYGEPGKPPAPPVVFTDNDHSRVDQLTHQIDRLNMMLEVIQTGKLPERLPDNQDRVDLIGGMTGGGADANPSLQPMIDRQIKQWQKDKDKYVAQKSAAEKELAALKKKERMWLWYRAGPWEGGVWSGIGARPTQQWLSVSLLDSVQPRHGFITKGTVDLELLEKLDVDALEKQLGALARQRDSATSLEEKLNAQRDADEKEIQLQLRRHKRAQAYAKELQKNQELRYRFRRDSLYRHIQQNRINIDKFVEDWFTANQVVLKKELKDLGLFTAEVIYTHTGRPVPTAVETGKVARKIRDKVKERLKVDIERSRVLLAAYLKTEEARKAKQEENVAKGDRLLTIERLGASLERQIDEEDFSRFLTGLRYSAVPRFEPKVQATFFKVPLEGQDTASGEDGGKLRESFRLDCQLRIDADPTIYRTPYRATIHHLSSQPDDIRLLPNTQQAISELRAEHAQALRDGDGFLALASVYAAGTPNLSGAIPQTIAGLPGIDGRDEQGVLLGQSVGFVESKPVEVRVDPLQVEVVDWAGNRLGTDASETLQVKLVEKAGEERMLNLSPGVAEPVYLGSHTFTQVGEKISIQVAFTVADGSTIHGNAEISIDGVTDWNDPTCLKPVQIRLPVLASGLMVKGEVELRPRKESDSFYPSFVRVRMPEFEISERIDITEAGKGPFQLVLEKPVKIHSQLQATAETVITQRVPQEDGTTRSQDVTFSGKGHGSVPAEPGTVDLGTLALVPGTRMVLVPRWDYQRPPTGQAYLEQLAALELHGVPRIAKRPEDASREFCVESVEPSAGMEVPVGSRVSVSLYGEFSVRVPDVVGMAAAEAAKVLEELGFRAEVAIGSAAESVDQVYVVQSQGVQPGTKREPGSSVPIVLFGPTVAMVQVPNVKGELLAEAERRIDEAGLKVEVQPTRIEPGDGDTRGSVAEQSPRGGESVERGSVVHLSAFDAPETITADDAHPYYQLFRLFYASAKPNHSGGGISRRDGESDGDYFERKKAFWNSQPIDRFELKEDGTTMVMHVSGEALRDYPPGLFQSGEKYFMELLVEANPGYRPGVGPEAAQADDIFTGALNSMEKIFRNSPDMRLPFATGFLLVADKRFTSLEVLNRTSPPVRDQNGMTKRSVILFQDGKLARITPSPGARTACVFGPITPGWAPQNIRQSIQLMALCFVATAVYGDGDAPQVLLLRDFRDRVLLRTPEGREWVRFYYHHGPGWARWVLAHPSSRLVLRPVLDAVAATIASLDLDSLPVRTGLDGLVRVSNRAVRVLDVDLFKNLPPLARRFRDATEPFNQQENRSAQPMALSP